MPRAAPLGKPSQLGRVSSVGSELGVWTKPSLGQRAGAVVVPVMLVLLLSPFAAVAITSTQDVGAQPAENQLTDNQISENHVLIETWNGVVQALAAWQLVETWMGVILENRPLDNQIAENQVADNQVADNQVVENQISISSGAITVVIGNIAAGESGTADFSACENMPLEEVTITLLENSADVSITVRTFASEPAGLPALKFAAVYAYLDISTNVQENLIESATIGFSVPNSWIHANQIDVGTVTLYHCDNAWRGLTTTWARKNNKCVYFSAQSSGFSCAIAGTRGRGKEIVVTFDRQLSGDRVGQHKVPPLSLVNMKITAEVSSQVENATLIDYFPNSWTVADAKGGIVSSYDEDYNKIEWNVDAVSDSVSKSYVLRSPQLTLPPTKYYFHFELTYEGGSATSDEWRVKVADPSDPDTGWKSPSSYANKDLGWREDEASNSAYSTDDGYAAKTSTNNRGCDYLTFGCNVPSGSIINGIEVSLEGHHLGGSYYPCKFSARLIKNGVEVGNEKIVANNYGHTDSTQTLGGATDLWGVTWTYSDINATNFGVRVETCTYFYLPATMYLDHVQVKVYYTPPPGRPILVSPENATQTSDTPTFVWQIGSNADNHRIEVDNDFDFSSPVDNVVFGAMDNTWTKPYPGYLEDNYYWRVWAINACGKNCSENAWIFKVITPLPGKPVLYSPADGTMTNDNTPTFEWTVGSNADNHHLLVDASPPDWTGCAIDTTILMPDNTYTPTTGLADDNYSWKVIAVNPKGENVSGVWTFFVDTQAPPAPTLQSPSDGTLTNEPTQTFDWSDVNDQSGVTYEIWIDNDSNFSSPENLENVSVSQYTTTLADENYSWRVKIYDGAGNENESANWTILIDTQPPIAPTLELSADGAITSDSTPTFDWSDISDAENYDLIVDDDAGFPSPEIQETISVSTYTPTTELADENYFWKVIVRDLVGHENGSDVWTFIVDTTSFYTYVATYENVKGTVENFDNQKQEGDGYSMLYEEVSEGEEGEKNISVAQLVCNVESLDDEDMDWNTWLTNRDFISSVTYLSASDVTKEQLESYDVVFMCHSVSGEPNVATAVKPANVGVMFVNRRAYNTMKFGTGHNYVLGQTQVTIVDNSHYITSPYPEDNVTYTSSSSESYISGWSGDIQCLGKIPGQDTQASILVLDKGEKHIDGSIAPERRVFSGLGYYGPFNMNENGDNLDERALRWVIRAYSLNIYENIEDVPSGENHYLEILYKLDNIKDNFRVQVWNGTSWENRSEILDSTSWEFWSYKLLDNEFTGDGDDVQIRFVDVDNESVKPNAILKDYLRVRTVLLVAPQWQVVETWTGTVQAPVGWNLIESWSGTIQAPAAWQVIETWTGTVSAPVEWQLIESWAGTVEASAEWQVIESWMGTVQAPVGWQLIEMWTGTVQAPTEWQVIETWTGTVSAPAEWKLIETWIGTVIVPAGWQLTEMWTGTVEAPALWHLIESWMGVVEAPLAWQLVETWVGTVEAVVTPSSGIGAISPYWQTSAPYAVTATALDPDGTVVTVTLWYRYFAEGSDWSAWTPFDIDNESPWVWSFTAPENDGCYEFYSVAKDNDNNEELAPAVADVQYGVDRMAPTITSVVINDNAGLTSSVDVTISIDASDATSGLAEMRFSLNNVEWSDWGNFTANKSYTLPTGDGLKTVYVQVKDKAGLPSTVASDSITLETITLPAPPPPVVVPPLSLIIPTPAPAPLVFFVLLAIFLVGVSGLASYRALKWRIKPFVSLKSLKRVVPARPAVNLARLKALWRIKPAISLKRMMPAPITLAPDLPTGPFKPIPVVTRPPTVGARKIAPKAMAPSEILERLKRGPAPQKPEISLKRLKREVFKKKKRRRL